MLREIEYSDTPTRQWEREELLNSRLMGDMIFTYLLTNGLPLTREQYFMTNMGVSGEEVTAELTAGLEVLWDFQDPEARIPWEETDEPTIRDLLEHQII